MSASDALDVIVKAYDIRGTVPDQLDAEIAHALGVGFAQFTQSSVAIVARDMRPSVRAFEHRHAAELLHDVGALVLRVA